MKQRTISGIIMALIIIPFLALGNYFFAAFIAFLAIWSSKEIMGIKKEGFPLYLKIVVPLLMLAMIFALGFDFKSGNLNSFIINPLIIFLPLFILLMIVVVDHRFSLQDASVIYLLLVLVSFGLKGFMYLRDFNSSKDFFDKGLLTVIYLLLITCLTDIFAQFGGIAFKKILKGKVHLLNSISPKKTWEGSLTGSVVATLLASLFFILTLRETYSLAIPLVFLLTLLLSILGQFGDLFFSAVKRIYGIKDYSNLIPGHGGVLDRIDSLISVATALAFIISIL